MNRKAKCRIIRERIRNKAIITIESPTELPLIPALILRGTVTSHRQVAIMFGGTVMSMMHGSIR